jgi:hypothetical protein
MTQYYAIANGNHKDGTKWSLTPGGAPAGAYPGTGDKGKVPVGFKISGASSPQVRELRIAGGEYEFGSEFILDDVVDALLIIEDDATSKVSNLGTYSSPCVIRSANAVPVYPFTVRIEDIIGEDARSLDFDYCEFRGNYPCLGNDGYVIDFNGASNTYPKLAPPPPWFRDPITEEHTIDGRDGGRVYDRGSRAGVVALRGYAYAESYFDVRIRQMKASGQRLSFVCERTVLPKCKISRVSAVRKDGAVGYAFTLTLMEAR